MRTRYAQWMYDWETRLTSVDNNRVVRPLDWGLEWMQDWPCGNGCAPADTSDQCERFLQEYNRRIVSASDEFYSYVKPSDFQLERREVQVFSTREVPDAALEAKVRGTYADFLRFTSPVRTPFPENNLANARWFPARGRRALVLLPHWNSDAIAYTGLCRVLNLLGIAVLRLSMPYHDIRMPAEIRRADYAVSANIGRTLDACRQGVIDVRCCLDWHGQSTRHIREGLEPQIDLERLRGLWSAISPMSYFDQFSRSPKKSLIIYAKYDLTFLPEFSRQVVDQFARHNLDHKVVVLPCGHYTTGEAPYKYVDGWQIASFFRTAFDR